ncbi:hypothetical protein [Corallococcus interemptor]|uniref:hypothetical protein n=1 Tax=Corallococcus interemptor TaxID=2316720 RepID=UPI0011C3B8B3|nr:hypothetical protein [Corallococcus interemptor]
MPIRANLLSEIQAALGSAISPGLSTASAHSDIFEAYTFSLVLRAARAEGASIAYYNVDGTTPSTFVFRTSPGYIFSTQHAYTHAEISIPGKPVLEAHIGVRVEGKSRVLHECDVAVMFKDEAETCRMNSVSPRSAKVILAAECKFYASNLPLGMARAFLGLASDISCMARFLVVNTGSDSVEQLLSHRREDWEHQVVPGSNTVPRIENQFREVFKRFKALR